LDEAENAHETPQSERSPRRFRRTLGIGAMAVACAAAGAVAGAMTFPASHVGQAGADTPLSVSTFPTAASGTAACKTFAPPAGLPAAPGSAGGSASASGNGLSISISGDTNKGVTLCATAPSFPAGAGGAGGFGATAVRVAPFASGSRTGATCKSSGGGSVPAAGGQKGGTGCVKPPSSSLPAAPSGATTGVPAKGHGTKPHKVAPKQTCTSTPGLPAGVSVPGSAGGSLSLSGGGSSISVKASKSGLKVCHGPAPSLPKPPSLPALPGVPPVPATGGGSAPVPGDLPIPGL
jgi:hypothetical protein